MSKAQAQAQAQAQDQRPSSTRLFVTVGLIVVVVAVIGTFGLWKPSSDPAPTATPVFDAGAAAPVPAAPIAPGAPAPVTAGTRKPNEYDAANNRHWNADHGHWHPGPPPGTANTFGETTLLTPQAAPPQTVAPGAPKPFEYDEANNRHWNPEHGHWHPGPPPTPPSQP
ncbi:MAG: hypothetical protein GY715_02695 [Planctomycetes bacterium]|nr:hypothetical protein [Planctomycetota bacterium]